MYTGNRKTLNPTSESAPKAVMNGSLLLIVEGSEIYTGKIMAVSNDIVEIRLYCGDINGTWQPSLDGSGEYMKKIVKLNNVKQDMIFNLTKNNKLPGDIKQVLQRYM